MKQQQQQNGGMLPSTAHAIHAAYLHADAVTVTEAPSLFPHAVRLADAVGAAIPAAVTALKRAGKREDRLTPLAWKLDGMRLWHDGAVGTDARGTAWRIPAVRGGTVTAPRHAVGMLPTDGDAIRAAWRASVTVRRVVADAIHGASVRREAPSVAVACFTSADAAAQWQGFHHCAHGVPVVHPLAWRDPAKRDAFMRRQCEGHALTLFMCGASAPFTPAPRREQTDALAWCAAPRTAYVGTGADRKRVTSECGAVGASCPRHGTAHIRTAFIPAMPERSVKRAGTHANPVPGIGHRCSDACASGCAVVERQRGRGVTSPEARIALRATGRHETRTHAAADRVDGGAVLAYQYNPRTVLAAWQQYGTAAPWAHRSDAWRHADAARAEVFGTVPRVAIRRGRDAGPTVRGWFVRLSAVRRAGGLSAVHVSRSRTAGTAPRIMRRMPVADAVAALARRDVNVGAVLAAQVPLSRAVKRARATADGTRTPRRRLASLPFVCSRCGHIGAVGEAPSAHACQRVRVMP